MPTQRRAVNTKSTSLCKHLPHMSNITILLSVNNHTHANKTAVCNVGGKVVKWHPLPEKEDFTRNRPRLPSVATGLIYYAYKTEIRV